MASIRIIRAGLFTTIQDNGRRNLRHLGIPWAGTLCPAWQQISNALVSNPIDAPVLETFEGGLSVKAMDEPVRVAIIASSDASISMTNSDNESQSVAPLRSVTIPANHTLDIKNTGSQRIAVLAIEGLSLEKQLGSYSTYAKAELGGLKGCALASGDELSAAKAGSSTEYECYLPESLSYQRTDLRVVLGPQDDHFSEQGMSNFLSTTYNLSSDIDRMGARLQGAVVEHRNAESKDIVSDAIFPGSIQIPGSGQPIVLLNDAHTAGGYPKIATVVSADLPLMGLHRSGVAFRFVAINIDDAILSRKVLHDDIQFTIASISALQEPSLSSESLLTLNLIDGVTDGNS